MVLLPFIPFCYYFSHCNPDLFFTCNLWFWICLFMHHILIHHKLHIPRLRHIGTLLWYHFWGSLAGPILAIFFYALSKGKRAFGVRVCAQLDQDSLLFYVLQDPETLTSLSFQNLGELFPESFLVKVSHSSCVHWTARVAVLLEWKKELDIIWMCGSSVVWWKAGVGWWRGGWGYLWPGSHSRGGLGNLKNRKKYLWM